MKKNQKPIVSASVQKKRRGSSKKSKVEPIEIIEKPPIEHEQKLPTPEMDTESLNLKKPVVDEDKLKDLLTVHEKSLTDFIKLVSKYDFKKNDLNKSKLEENERKSGFFCFNCFGKKDRPELDTSIVEEEIELNAFEAMMKKHEENYQKFQKNIELVQEQSRRKEAKSIENQIVSDSSFK